MATERREGHGRLHSVTLDATTMGALNYDWETQTTSVTRGPVECRHWAAKGRCDRGSSCGFRHSVPCKPGEEHVLLHGLRPQSSVSVPSGHMA